MRATKVIFASLAIGGSLSVSAQGAANLSELLKNLDSYNANATFEVLLPQSDQPVVYDINLQSAAVNDTLAPCKYVIAWQTESPSGTLDGFSAYYDGNHYRYRNHRLQEYHIEKSASPFTPLGPGSSKQGVQYTAQFVDMLPQIVGERIAEIITDPSYIYAFHPDTVVGGKRVTVVDGVKRGDGYDVMRFMYAFDRDSHLPVLTEIESSPGSISEQIMTLTYTAPTDQTMSINEEGLMQRWPEVFEKYRQSTFKAENLVNTPLPAFSCRLLGSTDRFAHHSDEGLDAPGIFVFIDPEVSTTSQTVDAVREAVDMAPMDVKVYWVYNGNDEAAMSEAIGRQRQGEMVLTSAGGLVRDCGVTLYPTTIIVDRDAKVKDVIPGFNNDYGMIVLQKMMVIN